MDHSRRRSAEARRANVIYFLNRNGRIEHPHLIRIHHYCHSGVHLRDVKRWLSELRGKEMPDSFTWSYQRRYKSGFVWQDLMDDDLITPISNYEYVLLGSLHPSGSSSSPADLCSNDLANDGITIFKNDGIAADDLTATSSTIAQSKFDFFPFPEVDISPEKDELNGDGGVSAAPLSPKEETLPKEKVEDLGKSPAIIAGTRSYSWRTSHMLCNFLSCRTVETDDSVVRDTSRCLAAGAGDGGNRGTHAQVTKNVGSTRPLHCRQNNSYGSNNNCR